MDEDVDYYDFLSVEATATDAEIQRAYRRTNLKFHPDKFKPTPELSLEQAASKLDLLQKILGVLKDPAKRAEYDRKRENRRRKEAAQQQMALGRNKMAVDLHEREKNAALAQVNGLKRRYNELEKKVQDYQAANKMLGEALMKKRREEKAELRKAAEAQRQKDTPPKTDEKDRSVKVAWLKEGDGLDIDAAALEERYTNFGPVEDVRVMKDKKRRIDGRKEKAVFGVALVVFATLSAAQDAVNKGPSGGVESVEWAFKGTDPV
jgi:DnaJ family protein C protein 17